MAKLIDREMVISETNREAFIKLMNNLRNDDEVQYLSLANNQIDIYMMRALVEMLKVNKFITNINLENTGLNQETFSFLFDAVLENNNIIEIEISNNPELRGFDSYQLDSLLEINRNRLLENSPKYKYKKNYKRIEGAFIAELLTHEVLGILKKEPKVKEIIIKAFSDEERIFDEFLTYVSRANLYELTVSKCNLDAEKLYQLIEAIKNNKALKILDISHNKITDEGLLIIAAIIRECNLREIHIEGYPFSEESKEIFVEAVLQNNNIRSVVGIKTEILVEVLDIRKLELLYEIKPSDVQVYVQYKAPDLPGRLLDLQENWVNGIMEFSDFHDGYKQQIIDGLICAENVTGISFKDSKFSLPSIVEILESIKMKENITHISLSSVDMSDMKIVMDISKSLEKNDHIKFIDLSSCKLDNLGFNLFLTSLRKSLELTSIDLSNNKITSFALLTKFLFTYKYTNQLNIKDNRIGPAQSEDFLMALKSSSIPKADQDRILIDVGLKAEPEQNKDLIPTSSSSKSYMAL